MNADKMTKTTHNRYSILSSLPIDEQRKLCIMLCSFFSAIDNETVREQLQKPNSVPLSIMDFLMFYKNSGLDLWPKKRRITELISKLCQKGVLTRCGGTAVMECFWFMHELSNLQRLGTLWLGEILGPQYVGCEIEKDIAYITGVTPEGDESVGTGTLISSNVILTCGHVVSDMKVNNVISVFGEKVKVKNTTHHDVIDVGLIFLEDHLTRKLPDLAFRDAILLEEVVIAGYPTIPRSLEPVYTLQRGEISGFVDKTTEGYSLDLFSAIARPGNSGGPVVGLDGRIVGIVTRSLERDREEADSMSPMPFFASIPSDVIRKCVLDLTSNTTDIPWIETT